MYFRLIKIAVTICLPVIVILTAGCNIEGTENPQKSSSSEWKQVVNLEGVWRFSVGDNTDWASPLINDDNWELIKVPSSWENQGFHGYDGYGWYRNTFEVPDKYKNSILYLFLGYVDDVDQVFINGKQIGYSGSFPPKYRTAYDVNRRYPVPTGILNFGKKNTIAVRIYDDELEGGILRGNIGIYTPAYSLENGINLAGMWKFRTGDNSGWKDSSMDDSKWQNIIAPGYWETQGYPDYDGFAWYRKSVYVPEKYSSDKLVLILGRIDDIDETFVNGKLIGFTGDMNARDLGDHYLKLRGYYLSHDDLKYGGYNTIAVRIYDGFRDGGIYEGPLTIIPQKDYIKYWNSLRNGNNIFEKLFN